QPDFALRSTGASVIPFLTSATYILYPSPLPRNFLGHYTGTGILTGRPPVTALNYDVHDGHCWPFAGSQGQLGIALSSPIYIEAITIDHVASAIAVGRRTSAPQDMEVWALVEGRDNYIRIASFQYDIHSRNGVQTFLVDAEIKNLGIDFGVIVLVVKNNWGMGEYTCLYRIRVHGQR
ncbi:UNC-like C-terminal-domain-containing protein, partial [Mycena galopus ATCC 62051]